MEASRLGIIKERAPTVVLPNYLFFSDINEKGQAEVELEVVGQKVEDDENGNEVIKYVLEIVSINKINQKDARIT